jgi:hypothetical protein
MAHTESLEQRFHLRLLDMYPETGEKSTALGRPYWANRFLQVVNHRRRPRCGQAVPRAARTPTRLRPRDKPGPHGTES